VRQPQVIPRTFLVALFCLIVSVASGQTTDLQDEDVIRVDTDVTNVFFTAIDKEKRYVTTLEEADINVTEDGVPQKVLLFQRETDRPLSLAFLIDVSASEEMTLPQEKAAARTFVETIIRPRVDQAAVIPFTDRAFLEQAPSGNAIDIYRALERVDVALPIYIGSGPPLGGINDGPGVAVPPKGSTAIWDAISLTAEQVLSKSGGNRRRAIILLTDGQDTSSRVRRSDAIKKALGAETVIYAIGIGDSKHFEGIDKGALRTVSDSTGGRAFFPKRLEDLKTAFEEIETELRSQYLVAYSSSNKIRNGSYREMKIEISNPELRKADLKLRYRPGYYARPLQARPPGKGK